MSEDAEDLRVGWRFTFQLDNHPEHTAKDKVCRFRLNKIIVEVHTSFESLLRICKNT